MRIKTLDIGIERITNWAIEDETHLPVEGKSAPAFLPQYRPLDAILQRPSLDERLPDLLQPTALDPGLLEPAALTETRAALVRFFSERAATMSGAKAALLGRAGAILSEDERLDDEVRSALALLLRG